MPVQSTMEEGLRKCKNKMGVTVPESSTIYINHPVNSKWFFNTNKQPNEIEPSPINLYLILLTTTWSFRNSIQLPYSTGNKKTLKHNHPISPFLQSEFFLDLDKKKNWLTRKNNPHRLEAYSSLVVPKSIVVSGSPNRWQGIYNPPIGIIYHLYIANWVII